jgi:hypothetical protein
LDSNDFAVTSPTNLWSNGQSRVVCPVHHLVKTTANVSTTNAVLLPRQAVTYGSASIASELRVSAQNSRLLHHYCTMNAHNEPIPSSFDLRNM